jgi:hypothetical protein
VQFKTLTINETERNYVALAGHYASMGREMPIKSIQIASTPVSLPGDESPVQFSVTAEDSVGNLINADFAMLFVTFPMRPTQPSCKPSSSSMRGPIRSP